MKVLVILEYGIPDYRIDLFKELSQAEFIENFLVINSDKIYKGSSRLFKNKCLNFVGNTKLGFHSGLLEYIKKFDIIISSFNIRVLSCWIPSFLFLEKQWIFWGKGLGTNRNFLINAVRRLIINRADKVLVYNKNGKEKLIKVLNLDCKQKIEAVNNTVRVTNHGIPSDFNGKYFLYFGRIQERKGLIELINCYKEFVVKSNLGKEIPKLRFVGNGKYKEVLKEHVKQNDILNLVDFEEGVYNDESIKEHFRQAIAYVCPYNVGLAVVNSFAYGVPVITIQKKQIAPEFHYLNECNSFVCKGLEEFTEKLSYLSNLEDVTLMKKKCYDFFKIELSHDNMVETFIKAINEVRD